MTILVDDRIGSADLQGHLRHWRLPCEVTRLEYGDAAILGNGRDGPVPIGVEIKKVRDALNCMGDGRFAGHQLPGLLRTYDRVWLVVEGPWWPDFRTGLLMVPKGGRSGSPITLGTRRFMYRDLDNWLVTMEVMAGLRVRRTGSRTETARFVADLWSWWSKPWGDHRAHLAFDESRPDTALIVKPGLVRVVAAQLPGIGWIKSQAVAKKFRTVHEMVMAPEVDWAEIEGIGETMADRIWRALHGTNDPR